MEDIWMVHLMWARSKKDYTMGEATEYIHERSWADSIDPKFHDMVEMLNDLSRDKYSWNVEV